MPACIGCPVGDEAAEAGGRSPKSPLCLPRSVRTDGPRTRMRSSAACGSGPNSRISTATSRTSMTARRPGAAACANAVTTDDSSKRHAASIRSTHWSPGPLHTAAPSRTRAAAITFAATQVSFELAEKRKWHTISILWLFVNICMENDRQVPDWARSIKKGDGPVYLAIANAISAEIAAGRLAAGTCLPAQRALAELLGLDFTTVSRAYTELQRRGLTHGRVGQGTYVREARTAPAR